MFSKFVCRDMTGMQLGGGQLSQAPYCKETRHWWIELTWADWIRLIAIYLETVASRWPVSYDQKWSLRRWGCCTRNYYTRNRSPAKKEILCNNWFFTVARHFLFYLYFSLTTIIQIKPGQAKLVSTPLRWMFHIQIPFILYWPMNALLSTSCTTMHHTVKY